MYISSSKDPRARTSSPLLVLVVASILSLIGAGLGGAFSTASADNDHSRAKVFKGLLRDLQPTTVEPFDGARAKLRMLSENGHTWFTLRVRGIDRSAVGHEFGAHLHLGPCVAGDGAAALGHYNTDVLAGITPPRVDDTTEVWLDFLVERNGTARSVTYVPFVPIAGDRSVVIHEHETDVAGVAGNRLACLPVTW